MWVRMSTASGSGISIGVASKVTRTRSPELVSTCSVLMAQIVVMGWANRSMSSPAIRVWRRIDSSCRSVFTWSQRSSSLMVTCGSLDD